VQRMNYKQWLSNMWKNACVNEIHTWTWKLHSPYTILYKIFVFTVFYTSPSLAWLLGKHRHFFYNVLCCPFTTIRDVYKSFLNPQCECHSANTVISKLETCKRAHTEFSGGGGGGGGGGCIYLIFFCTSFF